MLTDSSATVGVTGTDWAYATGGITFVCQTANDGYIQRVTAMVTGNYAEAIFTGLQAGTTYEVWAEAIVDGAAVNTSDIATFTTKQPATSHSGWLELPAKTTASTASETTFLAGERNYTMLYDRSLYTAMWVAYPLAAGHTGTLARPGNWYFADGIAQADQIDLRQHSYGVSYTGDISATIYARGHQIPNGDRNGNDAMQKQTFYVTNSTPQVQEKFNNGIWGKMEDDVRGAIPSRDSIYIVTGPVFRTAGGSETVKIIHAQDDASKDVPVPNYYFKAVLKVKRSGSAIVSATTVGAWFEHKQYGTSDWTQYIVSVDEIERRTGYDLFANLPDDIKAAAEQNTDWTAFKSF